MRDSAESRDSTCAKLLRSFHVHRRYLSWGYLGFFRSAAVKTSDALSAVTPTPCCSERSRAVVHSCVDTPCARDFTRKRHVRTSEEERRARRSRTRFVRRICLIFGREFPAARFAERFRKRVRSSAHSRVTLHSGENCTLDSALHAERGVEDDRWHRVSRK